MKEQDMSRSRKSSTRIRKKLLKSHTGCSAKAKPHVEDAVVETVLRQEYAMVKIPVRHTQGGVDAKMLLSGTNPGIKTLCKIDLPTHRANTEEGPPKVSRLKLDHDKTTDQKEKVLSSRQHSAQTLSALCVSKYSSPKSSQKLTATKNGQLLTGERTFVRSYSAGSGLEARSESPCTTVTSRPILTSKEDVWVRIPKSPEDSKHAAKQLDTSREQKLKVSIDKSTPKSSLWKKEGREPTWKTEFKIFLRQAERKELPFKFLMEEFQGKHLSVVWWASLDRKRVYLGQCFRQKLLNLSPESTMRPPLREEHLPTNRKPISVGNLPESIETLDSGQEVVFEGRGHLLEHNTFHSGYFKNGRREGPGQLILLGPGGACYKGFWRDGEMQGMGSLNTQSGYQYIGEWLHSQQDGTGEESWPDGSKYQGNFAKGKRNGHGQYVEPQTSSSAGGMSRYRGEFRDGLFDGFGTLEYASGAVFVGNWKGGVMHGLGKYTWPDGSYFQGEYLEGVRTQAGIIHDSDKEICLTKL